MICARATGGDSHSPSKLLSEVPEDPRGTIAATAENVPSHRPQHNFDSMVNGLRHSSSAWNNQSYYCDADSSSAIPVRDSVSAIIYIYAIAMHAR